jgi:hypothetical protein
MCRRIKIIEGSERCRREKIQRECENHKGRMESEIVVVCDIPPVATRSFSPDGCYSRAGDLYSRF